MAALRRGCGGVGSRGMRPDTCGHRLDGGSGLSRSLRFETCEHNLNGCTEFSKVHDFDRGDGHVQGPWAHVHITQAAIYSEEWRAEGNLSLRNTGTIGFGRRTSTQRCGKVLRSGKAGKINHALAGCSVTT